MAPKYTLSYFPIKALGEPIRLILSYSNIEFEDRRISEEEWPKYKKSMPMGQMPILQIDDKVLNQSNAICRCLARQNGLAGSNEWEDLEIDIAVDNIHDLRLKASAAYWEEDEKVKETKFAALESEIPFLVKNLEAIAAKNKGHMVLGKLTWADFLLAGVADYLNLICRRDIFADNPNLKAVVDNVLALPAIKAWYAKSPKCDY